ncbi:MAG: FtsX-like permease family protein [Gammaproteobacteria bacterium]
MKSVLTRASRNFLWRHPWQLALSILGIALGVAVVIAIDLAMESALDAFDRAGKAFSGAASYRIVARDGGLEENLYRQLRVEQGIQRISPVVKGYVSSAAQVDSGFTLVGIDPFIERSFQSVWHSQDHQSNPDSWIGRLVAEPDTALISRQTASRLELNIEDELLIHTGKGAQLLKIIGFLSPNNAVSEQLLSDLIITDIATAQEVFDSFGRLSFIDVLMDARDTGRMTKIRDALPRNVQLMSVEDQSQAVREMTRAFSINLKGLGLLSLLVGMFLIYNTMTFLVMQRRRLIGTLRSLGVTRGQIFKLIIGEAVVLAAIGILIGIAAGVALGQGVLLLISGTINAIYFRIDPEAFSVTPPQLIKGAALGMAATLLAVLPAAFEATRISPVTVLVRSRLESKMRGLIRFASGGSGVFIAGGTALAYLSGNSIGLGLASVFLLLFGFAMLAPVMTLILMKALESAFGRFSRILARLPPRMVAAEISRTGIAIAALMIAVAATIGMDLMIGSFRQTVADWLHTILRADLYISLPAEKMPGAMAEEDHRLKARVAALAEVDRLSSILNTEMVADGELTKVSVYEMNEKSRKGFIFKHKIGKELWSRFERDRTVIVTEPYAYHHGVKVGGKILLQTDQGDQFYEIIGIYADYSGDRGHLAMSRRNYRQFWADLGYTGIGVYARDGANLKKLERQIGELIKGQQSVKANRSIYRASMEMFDQTFTVTEALRGLSALIAFVGVFSAFMAIQFERTREFGVLRAIGITPSQLSVMMIGETALMGLAAGLIAIPVGYIVAYLLIFVIYQRSFGWTLAFHFDSVVIYQGLALALVSATLAGILPALRMAKTGPAVALRME